VYDAYDGQIRVEKLRRGGMPMVVDRISWSDSLIMERVIPAFTRWAQQQQAEFAAAADALREMEANRHHQKQPKQLRHPPSPPSPPPLSDVRRKTKQYKAKPKRSTSRRGHVVCVSVGSSWLVLTRSGVV
jgi:hypothetical protein